MAVLTLNELSPGSSMLSEETEMELSLKVNNDFYFMVFITSTERGTPLQAYVDGTFVS